MISPTVFGDAVLHAVSIASSGRTPKVGGATRCNATSGVDRALETIGECPTAASEATATLPPPSWPDVHLAAKGGDAEALRKLLLRDDARAMVNARVDEDWTALHIAAALCVNADAVQLLLDGGADRHALTQDGYTPLLAAARCSRVEVFAVLWDGCADTRDIDATCIERWTPLQVAAAFDQIEVLKFLLNKFDERALLWQLSVQDADGNTALHLACMRASFEVAETLLASSPAGFLHRANKRDETPLALSVARQCQEHARVAHLSVLTRQLIERGSRSGPGVLRALVEGNVPLAKTLAGIMERTYGMTLLHYAAATGLVTVMEELVGDSATGVNAGNHRGYTALHYAAHYLQLGAVKVLLANGADVSLRSERGTTAIDVAKECVWDTGFEDTLLLQGLVPLAAHSDDVPMTLLIPGVEVKELVVAELACGVAEVVASGIVLLERVCL